MNKKNKYIIGFILFFILFFSFNKLLFNKKIINQNYKNATFDIYSQNNIKLENNLGINGKTEKYKIIKEEHKIGKGFFINNYGEFLTAKHLFENNNSKYFIKINNKNYDFQINKVVLALGKNKDIVLGKIQKFKNKDFLSINFTKHDFLIFENQDIFIIKNNIKKYGKIIGLDKKIIELNLDNLIQTNIKLSPGDSGTPLFNNSTNTVIGIASAIKNNKDISYFSTIKNLGF